MSRTTRIRDVMAQASALIDDLSKLLEKIKSDGLDIGVKIGDKELPIKITIDLGTDDG